MRSRSRVRLVTTALMAMLAAAVVGPASVAAVTLGFTLGAPSVSTVQYSDLVTFRGTYTCVNDVVSDCPTTSTSQTATFSLRPSGGPAFTNVASVATSLVFTSNPAGCVTACSVPFQVVWRAGRAGTVTIPPGVYDLRLTTTISAGELISLSGLTITTEDTTTTYTGSTSGLGGDALSLGGSVVDFDRGLSPGTGIITPDANLAGASMVSFALYDSTNTTLVVGPVAASLTPGGVVSGSPTLTPPTAGGSFRMRTTYVGNGYYNTSSDLDVITVAPSNTPPSLVLPGGTVVAEATSPAGASVNYVVSATDAEDDPDPTPSCTPSSGSTFAVGDTTVSCSVTDAGGATTTGSFTVEVRDTTSPSVVVTTSEKAAGTGWYNAASNDGVPGLAVDVSDGDLVGVVTLECTDNGVSVGSLAAGGDSFVLGDGSHAVSCTATDAAGNSATSGASFDVDQTVPSISGALSPAAAGTGWWNASTGAPTVTWTCGDTTSGVVSCSAPSTFGEGAGQSATGTAVDTAGNVGTAGVSGVNVDLTAPSAVSFVGGGLVDGGSYAYLFVPEGPTGCTATDTGSGLASCGVVGYSTAIGVHVLTASAADVAGNAAGATLTYSVVSWTLVGFNKPIEMDAVNALKAGNTAQLRFDVLAGSTKLDTADVLAGVDQLQVICGTSAPSGSPPPKKKDQANVDASGGHLTVRWDSPNLPGTCWLVTVRTIDGSSLSALFKLK
ncbi:MAG TPA: PxKF domain-containing protein [Patescibacteria group bacterium]|nr:PxKF domain-containing protein [Patescibacteria group bacterium]